MKIICIGRNYAAHAAELNNPIPETPLLFMKPDTAVLKTKNHFIIRIFQMIFITKLKLSWKYAKPEKISRRNLRTNITTK